MKLSVKVCSHCRSRNLTLAEEKMGLKKCADCIYFESIGVYTIEQYNAWLKKNKTCACN